MTDRLGILEVLKIREMQITGISGADRRDPTEAHDLAGDQPELVQELEIEWRAWRERTRG